MPPDYIHTDKILYSYCSINVQNSSFKSDSHAPGILSLIEVNNIYGKHLENMVQYLPTLSRTACEMERLPQYTCV